MLKRQEPQTASPEASSMIEAIGNAPSYVTTLLNAVLPAPSQIGFKSNRVEPPKADSGTPPSASRPTAMSTRDAGPRRRRRRYRCGIELLNDCFGEDEDPPQAHNRSPPFGSPPRSASPDRYQREYVRYDADKTEQGHAWADRFATEYEHQHGPDRWDGYADEEAMGELRRGSAEEAAHLLEGMGSGQAAHYMALMATKEAAHVFEAMGAPKAAMVMADMEAEKAAVILDEMDDTKAALILEDMCGGGCVDKVASIMEGMDHEKGSTILNTMCRTGHPEDASHIMAKMDPAKTGIMLADMELEDAARVTDLMSAAASAAVFDSVAVAAVAKIMSRMEPIRAAKSLLKLRSSHAGLVMLELDNGHLHAIVASMSKQEAATLFVSMDPSLAAEVVTKLSAHELGRVVGEMKPSEAALIASHLAPELLVQLVALIGLQQSAYVLELADPSVVILLLALMDAPRELITMLSTAQGASLFNLMPPAQARGILKTLGVEQAAALLQAMESERAALVVAYTDPAEKHGDEVKRLHGWIKNMEPAATGAIFMHMAHGCSQLDAAASGELVAKLSWVLPRIHNPRASSIMEYLLPTPWTVDTDGKQIGAEQPKGEQAAAMILENIIVPPPDHAHAYAWAAIRGRAVIAHVVAMVEPRSLVLMLRSEELPAAVRDILMRELRPETIALGIGGSIIDSKTAALLVGMLSDGKAATTLKAARVVSQLCTKTRPRHHHQEEAVQLLALIPPGLWGQLAAQREDGSVAPLIPQETMAKATQRLEPQAAATMLLTCHRTAPTTAVDLLQLLVAVDEAVVGAAIAGVKPEEEGDWGRLLSSLRPQGEAAALNSIQNPRTQARMKELVQGTHAMAERLAARG